jgi:ABC-type uncharacterized transport system substrate-binding protein
MRANLLRIGLLALAGLVASSCSALAHPHVFVTMVSELVYGPDGSVQAVKHAWTFDDMFSAFALQGLETKTKGKPTREELMPLAQTNVESLKDFDYFTYLKANGKKVELAEPPADYYIDLNDDMLTLHFTLPLKTPVQAKELDIEVYDPSYFVDFSFAEKDAFKTVGAPARCKLSMAKQGDPTAGSSEVPLDPNIDPSNWGSLFANKITVKCP